MIPCTLSDSCVINIMDGYDDTQRFKEPPGSCVPSSCIGNKTVELGVSVGDGMNLFIPFSYKGKNISSIRTQVCAKFMLENEVIGKTKSQCKNRRRRCKRKNVRINDSIQVLPKVTSCIETVLDGKQCFVSQSIINIGEIPPHCILNYYHQSSFKFVDGIQGSVHYLDTGEIAFIKVPREDCVRGILHHAPSDEKLLEKCISTSMNKTVDNRFMAQRGK